MPLSPDQEQLEHELRVEQMQTNIENNRLNMDKLRNDLKYESRKFLLQTLAVGATLIIATATVTTVVVNYVNRQAERDAVHYSGKF
jgi:hypothetical protein